jgi:ATP synthase H subunit
MSHTAASTSNPLSSEAELLEKIRVAEKDSSTKLEAAKKEAEWIVARAREQANALVQEAEVSARKKKEEIFSEGKRTIDSEIEKIHAETEKETQALRQKNEQAKNLGQVVLSILEQ